MTKFDLHIHSCYSQNLYGTRLWSPPSKSMPEDIIETAINKGIDVIAVTDHDNIIGSLKTIALSQSPKYKDKILVIPGVEVSSKEGHILAYNIYENIPQNLSAKETIDIINQKGGIAVAAHPFNVKYSLKQASVESNLDGLFALEMANCHSLKNDFTKKYIKKNKLRYTIGSDAHTLGEIGLIYGTTREEINSIDDLITILDSGKIEQSHYHTQVIWNILTKTVPGAIGSFFYWKFKQLHSLFRPKIFLPYKDRIE